MKVPNPSEPPQRKALFGTTCKVKGKVCKVIVYSRSKYNIASREMVNKLNFKRYLILVPIRHLGLLRRNKLLLMSKYG